MFFLGPWFWLLEGLAAPCTSMKSLLVSIIRYWGCPEGVMDGVENRLMVSILHDRVYQNRANDGIVVLTRSGRSYIMNIQECNYGIVNLDGQRGRM